LDWAWDIIAVFIFCDIVMPPPPYAPSSVFQNHLIVQSIEKIHSWYNYDTLLHVPRIPFSIILYSSLPFHFDYFLSLSGSQILKIETWSTAVPEIQTKTLLWHGEGGVWEIVASRASGSSSASTLHQTLPLSSDETGSVWGSPTGCCTYN